jgi:hypothetical protein
VSADGVVCLFIYCQVAVHPAAWQYPWHLPEGGGADSDTSLARP